MKLLLSHKERIKRRQIIQHALIDQLSSQQVEQAIALWDTLFHDSPTFVAKIFPFTSKLVVELNLSSAKKLKLMTSLMASFNLLKDAVIVEPVVFETQRKPMTDVYIIFNAILSEIIVYLKQHYAEDIPLFKQYLIEEIAQLELKPKAYQELLTWCQRIEKEGYLIHQDVNKDQMVAFMDFLYEELCSMFGAKQTDALFSTVVNHCEKYPEAKKFSPHNLI